MPAAGHEFTREVRTSTMRDGLLTRLVVLTAAVSALGVSGAFSEPSSKGAGGSLTVPTASTIRAQGETRVEYIAHAAFIIESPGGTRIAVDPYNGNNWLGYSFPEGLEADAVLVSHPHFDHDATYYFSDLTPVFRTPGEYRLGDVVLRGIESEHVGRMIDDVTPLRDVFNSLFFVSMGMLVEPRAS